MLYYIPNYINYYLKNCYLRTAIIFLDIFIFFFFQKKDMQIKMFHFIIVFLIIFNHLIFNFKFI